MAQDYPCFVMSKDSRGEWRWTYYAGNKEEIAVSSEGYRNKSDCRDSIDLIQDSNGKPVYGDDKSFF